MIYKDGKVVTDYTKRAKTDQSLRGIKKMMNEKPEEAKKVADQIIRNTYRTLMTRGQKGCFIYCTDKELEAYFKERLTRIVYEYERSKTLISKIAEERESYKEI